MTINSKKRVPLLFSAILLISISCNQKASEKKIAEVKVDTTATIQSIPPSTVQPTLKENILNEKTVIGNKRLANSPKIDKELLKYYSVKMLDSLSTDGSGFKYHIVDSLLATPGLRVLLIGREYESENIIWLAVYDSRNQLIDHKTVYYDNAEGFLSIETVIKKDGFTITTFNDYAEDEKQKKTTATYHLNENNKITAQN